ncbi:MAG: Clp protease N-terminal domain-containing protein [Candidatus Hydrogenedentales bacterium]
MSIAREEAARLGDDYVRTEHILLALCDVSDGTAGQLLQLQGVDLKALAAGVQRELCVGPPRDGFDEIPFMPDAKQVLEQAVEESRHIRTGFIGTDHILLGLIKFGGPVVSHRFNNLNIDLERVKRFRLENGELFRLRQEF